MEQQNTETNAKLADIAEQLKGMAAWMKSMDSTTKSLSESAALLQLHAEDATARLEALEAPPARPQGPAAASLTPPSVHTQGEDRPNGHGGHHQPRGSVLGDPRFPDLPPGNGMPLFAPSHHSLRPHMGSTPKMDFPKFDGEDHQVWLDNCELYFKIYGVSEHMKVKFASLNCVGNAALWLKMAQKRRQFVHWHELRTAVQEKWRRNRHKFHMRQLLLLSQSGSVDDYTTKFDNLRHQILLADPHSSEVFFVERYVAGLRSEIRTVVILHQPEDVDTASCLALLQEAELESDKSGGNSKYSQRSGNKQSNTEKGKQPDDTRKVAEKLEALHAYRKAKSLCFKCGEPWARGHKCPDKVPLHIMEELLEVLQLDAP